MHFTIREFLGLDDAFHRTVTGIANCTLAWEAIKSIKATMDRACFMRLADESSPESLIEQHYKIYRSLEQRDQNAAKEAIHLHLIEMVSTLATIATRDTDWFELSK
ncbi:FCD domain-containing protein [Yersinia aldovae]|nr:FCD domain-containing protein [Yersinia aldovae]